MHERKSRSRLRWLDLAMNNKVFLTCPERFIPFATFIRLLKEVFDKWDRLFWALVEVREATQVRMVIIFGQLKVKLLGGGIWGSRGLIGMNVACTTMPLKFHHLAISEAAIFSVKNIISPALRFKEAYMVCFN